MDASIESIAIDGSYCPLWKRRGAVPASEFTGIAVHWGAYAGWGIERTAFSGAIFSTTHQCKNALTYANCRLAEIGDSAALVRNAALISERSIDDRS